MDIQSIKLISWENQVVEVDFELAKLLKFKGNEINPGDEISLMQFEIDFTTLTLIRDFMDLKEQLPVINKPLPASSNLSIFPENSIYRVFFNNIDNDQLLLLTLAAYNLQYEELGNLCAAIIACQFAEMDADEVMADLNDYELETDEKDFYQWIGWNE